MFPILQILVAYSWCVRILSFKMSYHKRRQVNAGNEASRRTRKCCPSRRPTIIKKQKKYLQSTAKEKNISLKTLLWEKKYFWGRDIIWVRNLLIKDIIVVVLKTFKLLLKNCQPFQFSSVIVTLIIYWKKYF